MMRACLWSLLLAVGCKGDDDTTPGDDTLDGDADTDADTDTDTDADTDIDCSETITEIDPPNNAELVRLDREVVVTFSGPVPTGAPWSVDVTGATGTATLAGDSTSATWTPDGGTLPAEATLTVNAAVCEDTATSTFTTLPPPIDLADVENNTYVLDWDDLSIDEPPGAFLFESEITIELVLMEFTEVDPVTLDVPTAAAIGEDVGGTPAPICESAVEGVANFDMNPYFMFGPETLTFVVNEAAGTTSDAEDLVLIGRVMPGGAEVTDLRMSMLLATEDLAPNGETCADLQVALQASCVPCTISDTGMCMVIEGTAPSASLATDGVNILQTCAP